jgi:hypothetical protein
MRRLMFSAMTFGIVLGTSFSALAAPPPPPVATTMTIAVSPVSITPLDTAVVTATITPNTGTINCGTGQIQYNITHVDLTTTGWLQLLGPTGVVNNQISATFDPAVIPVSPGETVSFRADYTSSGGGCNFDGVNFGHTPTVDLHIDPLPLAVCPNGQVTGAFISIEQPGGIGQPAPGTTGTWTFVVKVQACENLFGVTAQGGANGWSTFKSFTPSVATDTVAQSVKNKNVVALWTLGDMTQGSSHSLTVEVTGTIKNSPSECGKVKLLNGDWSATYATVANGPRNKSAYSTYVASILVTCP